MISMCPHRSSTSANNSPVPACPGVTPRRLSLGLGKRSGPDKVWEKTNGRRKIKSDELMMATSASVTSPSATFKDENSRKLLARQILEGDSTSSFRTAPAAGGMMEERVSRAR